MSDVVSQRSIGNQKLRLVQRERMLELVGKLSVAIYTLCLGFAHRSNKHDTFILISSGFGINNTQFTVLGIMMSHENSHHFTCTGNLTGMRYRCREPAVHSVIFGLSCSVRIHLEQGLRPYLTAVIIVPTSVNYPTIVKQSRRSSMHLVETYLTHITSFTVAEVHIADFGKPAIHRTSATGRVEKYILIRQVDAFDIGVSFSESQLLDRTCL